MLTALGGERKFRSRKPARINKELSRSLRLIGLRIVILLMFLSLAGQLFRLQVGNGAFYEEKARNNQILEQLIAPTRGIIYDRTGRPLVRNAPSFTVQIVPARLPFEEQAAVSERLAKLLEMRPEEIEKPIALRRADTRTFNKYDPIVIAANVKESVAFTIEERSAELPGVVVRVDPVRQYLAGPNFAPILGYLGRINAEEYDALAARGYQSSERIGKAGIEAQFEEVLRGKAGNEIIVVDAAGTRLDSLYSDPAKSGYNLVLTIDADLQEKTAQAVRRTMNNLGESKYAVGLVMDVKTGELLAYVSLPGYDNNLFSSSVPAGELEKLLTSPSRPLVDHAIADVFPPGSIFKLITGGAALQEGVATTATSIFSKGYLEIPSEIGGPPILMKDWAAHGWLNFYEAMAKSGDVYFYQLGGGSDGFKGIGAEKLARYSRDFGLGELTGIELPGEAAGIVPTPRWKLDNWDEQWYTGDTYNMAIGQGFMTVTPLQMMMLLGAFSNGGSLLKPQIVKAVVASDNEVIQPSKVEVRRQVSISRDNMKEVLTGMELGVDWMGGTARDAAVPGIRIAAKTGTAEFGQRDAAGNYEFKHGWCYAVGPAEDPEIAVLVFDERGGGPQTAAPAVGEILRYYFARKAAQQAAAR